MPELPSTARGTATSRRILDAAAEEFAERGIAGARVDRIIQAARTNKAQLYAYFGGKDGLFDAVVADSVDRITDAVPFDAEDLPGWAVRMYDEYLEHPGLVRLVTWIRLERRPTGPLLSDADHRRKVDAVAAAQAAGRIRPGDPFDLLVMVIALSCAWSPASGVFTAAASDPAEDHDRRRALLHDSVSRAIAP
nr:TetR family transcriptional regulator [Dactylosporangium thailandense]